MIYSMCRPELSGVSTQHSYPHEDAQKEPINSKNCYHTKFREPSFAYVDVLTKVQQEQEGRTIKLLAPGSRILCLTHLRGEGVLSST